MAKYDKEMCDAWNGELDTMLTFVCGLLRLRMGADTDIEAIY